MSKLDSPKQINLNLTLSDVSIHFQIKDALLDMKNKPQITLIELARYFIFFVLFFVVLFNQIVVEQSYEITSGIEQALIQRRSPQSILFQDIYNRTDIETWIFHNLLIEISKPHSLTGDPSEQTPDSIFYIANFNKIIADIRATFEYGDFEDNPSERFGDFVSDAWVDFQASSNRNHGFDEFNGYGLGTELLIPNQYDRFESMKSLLLHLRLPSSDMKSVRLQIVTYNGHYNLFSSIDVKFDIHQSGFVEKSIVIQTINVLLYNTIGDRVRAFFEIVLFCLMCLYITIEAFRIKQHIYDSRSSLAQSPGTDVRWWTYVWLGLYRYIQEFWNIIGLSYLAILVVSMIVWLTFIADPFRNEFVDDPESFDGVEIVDGMENLTALYRFYLRLSAVNCILISFRLLKYLSYFRQINLLFNALGYARRWLFTYMFLLIGLIFSFVLCLHMLLGSKSALLQTVGQTTMFCLEVMFADFTNLLSLKQIAGIELKLWFSLFNVVILIICFSMFPSIILINYSYALQDQQRYLKQKRKLNIVKPHWTTRFRRCIATACLWIKAHLFRSRKSEVQFLKDKYTAKDKNEQHDSTFDISDINLPKAAVAATSIHPDLLTDKQMKKQVKAQRIKKGFNYVMMMFQLVFMVLFLVMVFLQIRVGHRHGLFKATREAAEDPAYTYDPDKRLTDIVKIDELVLWMQIAMPQILAQNNVGNYAIQNKNFLIGQDLRRGPIRLTIRRIELEDNETNFDVYEPKVRKVASMDPSVLAIKGEDREDFRGAATDNLYEYETLGGYNNVGGFVTYFSTDPTEKAEQLAGFQSDGVVNLGLNSAVLDWVTYNGELNCFTYQAIVVQFKAGGQSVVEQVNFPVKLLLYNLPEEIALGTLEIAIVLGVFGLILQAGYRLYKDNKQFNKEEHAMLLMLSQEQKAHLDKMDPPKVRRMRALFQFRRLYDFVFFILFFVSMILWIGIISFTEDHQVDLRVSDIEYFEDLNKLTLAYRVYIEVMGFTILFLALRMIQYIQLNSAISFLSETLKGATAGLAFYLLLLFSILFGFASMGYVVFGQSSFRFQSVGWSWFSCLELSLGTFDLRDLILSDALMGPIFFVVYMFFFYFILTNIFISILEQAYSKVLEKRSSAIPDNNLDFFKSIVAYCLAKCCRNKRAKELKLVSNPTEEFDPDSFWTLKDYKNDVERNPSEFAGISTEWILTEKSERQQAKDHLKKWLKIRSYNLTVAPMTTQDHIKEYNLFKDYWGYLQTGFRKQQKSVKSFHSSIARFVTLAKQAQRVEINRGTYRKRIMKKIGYYEAKSIEIDAKIKEITHKLALAEKNSKRFWPRSKQPSSISSFDSQ